MSHIIFIALEKNVANLGGIRTWSFDHEIFSIVILSLLLIQEGQLSVSGERMHNTG